MLYASTGYVDELAWAAAWLFKATGNQQYLTDAKTYYAKVGRIGNADFSSSQLRLKHMDQWHRSVRTVVS